MSQTPVPQTPLAVIAEITRIVPKLIDRLTGDRSDYPLLVCVSIVEALKRYGIISQIFYGPCAWIEILEDHSPVWTGSWGRSHGFWVGTQYGEVVDLNVSVSNRKISHTHPDLKPLYSPPMLWTRELPRFYRYVTEGVAEIELTEERDLQWFETVRAELTGKCIPSALPSDEGDLEFANEPILCPGRLILDDGSGTFKLYDRALSVSGIPAPPF